jgi:hypothetical protein
LFQNAYDLDLEDPMSEVEESGTKAHYVCQTYIAKTAARGQQGNLQIDKQLQYSTPHEAQERAEREFRAENCVGADAYMVIEDSDSGEVGDPTFLVRLGSVPEQD